MDNRRTLSASVWCSGGKGYTIVGVMPKEFAAPAIDLWIPAQIGQFLLRLRDARFYSGVAA